MDFPQDAEDLEVGIVVGTVPVVLINCILFAPLHVLLAGGVLVLHREWWSPSGFALEFGLLNGPRSLHNGLLTTPPCFCLICVKMAALLR